MRLRFPSVNLTEGKRSGDRGEDSPRLSVGVLLISPAMKEDSVCFRTVSFHILRIRLWKKEHSTAQ